ncbi:MAG: hypothetical protein R3B83_02680 [Nitrospirales bacterium]|nr:hypothetical protein [Nitrospirales bacterium]
MRSIPLTLKGVQDLLAPRVGLVSYFIAKNQLYLWLITQQHTRFTQVTVPDESNLLSLITRYRQLVQHLEPVEDESYTLYSWLIKPPSNRRSPIWTY